MTIDVLANAHCEHDGKIHYQTLLDKDDKMFTKFNGYCLVSASKCPYFRKVVGDLNDYCIYKVKNNETR